MSTIINGTSSAITFPDSSVQNTAGLVAGGTIASGTVTTLTTATLNSTSGVLATQNGMTGIAKAWVNFAGATGTITGSFNVSSVTRNSTGNYTINFTTSMPDSNYAIVGGVNRNGAAADAGGFTYFSQTTSSVGVATYAPQGSLSDVTSASFAIFR